MTLPVIMNKPGEAVSLETGSSDQGTVNIGLNHEVRDIVGFDASTVENADRTSGIRIEAPSEPVTNRLVHLLSLCRGGGLASANCPDRFVSEDTTNHLLRCQAGKIVLELPLDDSNLAARLPFREGLPTAEDGGQTEVESGAHFAVDDRVGVAVEGTTLGVADDDVRAAGVAEHITADFPGVRAVFGLGGEVLGRDVNVAAFEAIGNRFDGKVRWGDNDVAMGRVGDKGFEGGDGGDRVPDQFEHLPVTSNDRSAHL